MKVDLTHNQIWDICASLLVNSDGFKAKGFHREAEELIEIRSYLVEEILEDRRRQKEALDEMTKLSEELGLYDE